MVERPQKSQHPGLAVTDAPALLQEAVSPGLRVITVALGITVALAITGGEALYADIGHFGRFPIRFAWFALGLPTLVLNYFGQGALILGDKAAIENPFFEDAPETRVSGTAVFLTSEPKTSQ